MAALRRELRFAGKACSRPQPAAREWQVWGSPPSRSPPGERSPPVIHEKALFMQTKFRSVGVIASLAISVLASGCCGPCGVLCNPFNVESGNERSSAPHPEAAASKPAA